MAVFRFLNGLTDRVFIVAGAFFGSQIPTFMHQYTQRLAGHVAELSRLINELTQIASQNNKTLALYIRKFTESSDADYISQGNFLQSIELRRQSLADALTRLHETSVFSKFYVFLEEIRWDVFKPAFYSFQPGISLTPEGICYTIVGMMAGYVIYRLLFAFTGLFCRRFYSLFKLKKAQKSKF